MKERDYLDRAIEKSLFLEKIGIKIPPEDKYNNPSFFELEISREENYNESKFCKRNLQSRYKVDKETGIGFTGLDQYIQIANFQEIINEENQEKAAELTKKIFDDQLRIFNKIQAINLISNCLGLSTTLLVTKEIIEEIQKIDIILLETIALTSIGFMTFIAIKESVKTSIKKVFLREKFIKNKNNVILKKEDL